ncbi:MAG: hypothetical protein V1791_04950 [Pseudomonadota bacterium]
MVSITCMCGFEAECGAFIPPNIVRWIKGKKVVIAQNYYLCRKCGVKFRGPKNITEIGVQVLKDNKRYELPLSNKVDQEIQEWKRDEFLKYRKTDPQFYLIQTL